MKTSDIVTATFSDPHTARAAFDHFRSEGYGEDELNLLMSEKSQAMVFAEGMEAPQALGAGRDKSQIAETAAGAAIGSMLGMAAGVAMAVLIPGMGLVLLGPMAAALAGAGTGAAAGGTWAAFRHFGIEERDHESTHRFIEQGGVLLGVALKGVGVDRVREELIAAGGTNIRVHHYHD